jgi:ADP-heptose:LPS heptosyltransferase
MHYVLEFGGGLGDVLYQLYERGAYNVLRDLQPGDTADVWIVSHNPHVGELFQWHPKREQLNVRQVGYWSPDQDRERRRTLGMPSPHSNSLLPAKDTLMEFHVCPDELAYVQRLESLAPYVLVAAGAGLPDRNIPDSVVETILNNLDCNVILVGRSYDRLGRYESLKGVSGPRIENAIDRLSVPATARLVQQASGLVTAHSALNLLGWKERIPQLLLYPQSVLDQHARGGRYDQWMFGAHRTDTVHGLFDNFTPDMVTRFKENLK